MASIMLAFKNLLFPLALLTMVHTTLASRMLLDTSSQIMSFQYHNGSLLSGQVSINFIWYGNFKPAQKVIISDFITSLSSNSQLESQPSVSSWWNSLSKLYPLANSKLPTPSTLSIGQQVIDDTYSLGKTIAIKQLKALASKGPQQPNGTNIVLTSADVAVEGFCMSRCGTHGSINISKKPHQKFTFIWVGNSETQCPGQCAWPFHQPIYGPQSAPLIAPNNDVGMDGMVINLASLLAGTVTNPYGNGYFQGPQDAPLEAASARSGIYGKGAYPGYAGNLLVDSTTGASYNANGINHKKYLLPALYDPTTSSCSTLI